MPYMTSRHIVADIKWDEVHADCLPWGARWEVAQAFAKLARKPTEQTLGSRGLLPFMRGFLMEPSEQAIRVIADRAAEAGVPYIEMDALAWANRLIQSYYRYCPYEFEEQPQGWVGVFTDQWTSLDATTPWTRPDVAPHSIYIQDVAHWIHGQPRDLVFPSKAAALRAAKHAHSFDWMTHRFSNDQARVYPYRGVPNAHQFTRTAHFCREPDHAPTQDQTRATA